MKKFILNIIWFLCMGTAGDVGSEPSPAMQVETMDKQKTIQRLQDHLSVLTHHIGERSVRRPDNLEKTANYLQAQFEDFGFATHRQSYRYKGFEVSNVVATLKLADKPAPHYVVGAHYDTVGGTVGADDNASGVAVLLETARAMQVLSTTAPIDLNITFVAFTLEESPAFLTRHMGSYVFAKQANKEGTDIAGMICLEMVGYSCRAPGCQHYPFPLQFLGYPKDGTFIGIVGNLNSLALIRRLRDSFRQNPDLPVATLAVPFNGWILPAVRLSDHASFWDRGFRAVMVTDTAYFRNPNYHLPSDTKQTLDFAYMAELVGNMVRFFNER